MKERCFCGGHWIARKQKKLWKMKIMKYEKKNYEIWELWNMKIWNHGMIGTKNNLGNRKWEKPWTQTLENILFCEGKFLFWVSGLHGRKLRIEW